MHACKPRSQCAGKSTLLSKLSSAKPKIANYAFTTLVPNLGVCELDYQTTVFADVPGLIEGAHDGHGLGHEFLRHCSRARALVHVLDCTARDPVYDYEAIQLELQLFGMGLADKPQIVAYNKLDIQESTDQADKIQNLLQERCGIRSEMIVPMSAATGQGVLDLVRIGICRGTSQLVIAFAGDTLTACTQACMASYQHAHACSDYTCCQFKRLERDQDALTGLSSTGAESACNAGQHAKGGATPGDRCSQSAGERHDTPAARAPRRLQHRVRFA